MNESRPGMGQQHGGLGGQPAAQQPIGLGGRITPQSAQAGIRPAAPTPQPAAAAATTPKAVAPAKEEEFESIALEEVEDAPASATPASGASTAFPTSAGGSKIHAFSVGSTMYGQENFRRVPHVNKTGACRVRSFHGRLSDSGLDYLDHAINEWLEKHPDVEVKFVTSTTGMYDGKIKEPALILNLWY